METSRRSRGIVFPIILIIAGLAILSDNLNLHWNINLEPALKLIVPAGMILFGVFFLMERTGIYKRQG